MFNTIKRQTGNDWQLFLENNQFSHIIWINSETGSIPSRQIFRGLIEIGCSTNGQWAMLSGQNGHNLIFIIYINRVM